MSRALKSKSSEMKTERPGSYDVLTGNENEVRPSTPSDNLRSQIYNAFFTRQIPQSENALEFEMKDIESKSNDSSPKEKDGYSII